MSKYNVEIDSVGTWTKHEYNNGGIRINWSANIGFGQLDIFMNKEGRLIVDSEYMGKDFVLEVLEALVDNAYWCDIDDVRTKEPSVVFDEFVTPELFVVSIAKEDKEKLSKMENMTKEDMKEFNEVKKEKI